MIARFKQWRLAWQTAYYGLYIQLCGYREMTMTQTAVYLPDDATEEELAELAAEQRALRH